MPAHFFVIILEYGDEQFNRGCTNRRTLIPFLISYPVGCSCLTPVRLPAKLTKLIGSVPAYIFVNILENCNEWLYRLRITNLPQSYNRLIAYPTVVIFKSSDEGIHRERITNLSESFGNKTAHNFAIILEGNDERVQRPYIADLTQGYCGGQAYIHALVKKYSLISQSLNQTWQVFILFHFLHIGYEVSHCEPPFL